MSHRKKINSMRKNIFSLLPKSIKRKIVLEKLTKDLSLDTSLIIKFASTQEEIEDSLNVLYSSYRDSHLTNFNKHKLKVTKYHALPTTHVIVAYYKGKPVGTMSIIPDGHFDLPIEEHWNIENARKDARKVCEIGSLAILPEFQKMSGKILLPMIAYAVRSGEYFLKIDHGVIAIHPNAQPVYEFVLGAKRISNKIVNYDMANGAKAIGMYINFANLKSYLKEIDPNDNYGLYHYFFEKNFADVFEFCWDDYSDGISHVPNPEVFNKLFTKVMDINSSLNQSEKQKLKSFYNSHSHTQLIHAADDKHLLERESFRYLCSMKATMLCNKQTQLKVEVTTCSEFGAALQYNNDHMDIELDDQVTINIKISMTQTLAMSAQIKYMKDGVIGVAFIRPISEVWKSFIKHIEKKYHVDPSLEEEKSA